MNARIGLIFPIVLSLLSSCIVDREMDFKKDLDATVTVIPGMTVNFGSTRIIRTGAVLDNIVQAGKVVSWINIVDFDPSGNICFSTGSKPLQNVPLIDGDILRDGKQELAPAGTARFDAASSASVELKTAVTLTGSPELTEGIDAVRNIETAPFATELTLALSAKGASSLMLKQGFRITLPDFLTVKTVREGSRFAADGDHALSAKADFTLRPEDVCSVSLELTAARGESLQKGKAFELSGDLLLSGQITATPGEGFAADSPLTCRLTFQNGKATLAKADVHVAGTVSCGNLDTYPAVVNYAKPYVCLSDLELVLQGENRMSVPLDLDTRLVGEAAMGDVLCDHPVGLHEKAAPVQIPAGGKSAWLFSGNVKSEGYTPYLFPGLENLVQKSEVVHFGFKNFRITPGEASWQTVSSDGKGGLIQGTAQLFMPFMIGKGVDSALNYKFGHFQVDTTMTLDKLTPIIFEMDIENSIPVGFRFAAEIVDKDGNVVTQYRPIVEGSVQGGTPDDPGHSKLSIGFTTREIVPFDGIKLTLTVDSEAQAGRTLNRYQGITFQNLRLVMPDGLTFDPAWLKYVQYVLDVKRVVDDVIEIVDSFK